MNICEINLKELLDTLIERKKFEEAEKTLAMVKDSFSLYNEYKELVKIQLFANKVTSN